MSLQQKYSDDFSSEIKSLVQDLAPVYKVGALKKSITYKYFLRNRMLIVHSIRKGIS